MFAATKSRNYRIKNSRVPYVDCVSCGGKNRMRIGGHFGIQTPGYFVFRSEGKFVAQPGGYADANMHVRMMEC